MKDDDDEASYRHDDVSAGRVYVHTHCGGQTRVSGGDFTHICDPFLALHEHVLLPVRLLLAVERRALDRHGRARFRISPPTAGQTPARSKACVRRGLSDRAAVGSALVCSFG